MNTTGVGVRVGVAVKVGVTECVGVIVCVSVMVQVGVTVGVIEWVGVIVCVCVMVHVGEMVGVYVAELFAVTGVVIISGIPRNPDNNTPLSRAESLTSDMTIRIIFPAEPGAIDALVVSTEVDPLYSMPFSGGSLTFPPEKKGPFIIIGEPVVSKTTWFEAAVPFIKIPKASLKADPTYVGNSSDPKIKSNDTELTVTSAEKRIVSIMVSWDSTKEPTILLTMALPGSPIRPLSWVLLFGGRADDARPVASIMPLPIAMGPPVYVPVIYWPDVHDAS